jgi:hypothetical protein
MPHIKPPIQPLMDYDKKGNSKCLKCGTVYSFHKEYCECPNDFNFETDFEREMRENATKPLILPKSWWSKFKELCGL